VLDLLGALDCSGSHKADCARWLDRVRERLEDVDEPAPSIAELSALAGVHPVHMARAFRRRFGCSIGAFARRIQVGKALILFEDSTIDLCAAAYDTGFADQSHMTRLVRAHTGQTPGAWRRWILKSS